MKRIVTFTVMAALVALPLTTALGQPQQPQQRSQGAGGAQSGEAQSGVTIASDSLVGTEVRDSQGKEVGEVSKLLIDPKEGKVTSVIIKQGGTLGMGGKEVSVPWDALKIQQGQDQRPVVTMQRDLLEQAPAASPATGGQDQSQQDQQQRQPKQQQ
jgi:sporulation protein YlmC with PRC-barrel domain